jgi:putative ABC transport system substrate-binding protein
VAGEYVLLRDSGCTVISRRRLLTGFVLAWAPLGAAAAQEYKAGKVWRIGLLDYSAPDPARQEWWNAFRQQMRQLGYMEGQNVHFEPRSAEGDYDRLQRLAAELVGLKVDVIVTGGQASVAAARQATSSIPIVMATGRIRWPAGS